MYQLKHIIGKRSGTIRRFNLFLAVLMLLCCVLLLFNYSSAHASADTSSDCKLQNGSFEENQTWTARYSQLDQSKVPGWNTTAFQGKIEMFRENTGTYITGVKLAPTDGTYAAELNADEESTLYQNVKTTPSSVYEWGLDHGGRNGTDTMALVIGPKQSVNPSKPSKDGRDQLMQMVDWLIEQGKTSVKTSAGLGEHLVVYSKKFAANGTFEDNTGNNAFSLTPSTIYTEEWHIWIMASSKVTSGVNPWNSYGSNAERSSAGGSTESGSNDSQLDLNKYYLYTVPTGQTETLFGFVSVGYVDSTAPAEKAKTFGNFLDNINFQIYHPLSGSTTTHGSAVIGGSDGTTEGIGGAEGYEVTIDNKLTTYVLDGEPLKIQAIIKKADVDDGCEFVGVHYTTHDVNGNLVTQFLKLKGGNWIESINNNGDIIYTYYLDGVTSATDLHFIFIKSPTVTYDPNGGKAYIVESEYNTDEADNVYSFKPAAQTTFISPYVSHAAEGQNDGWKFMGWLLTGDSFDGVPTDIQLNTDQLGSLILPAEHTVACDYTFSGFNRDTKAQYFKIYNGNVTLNESINNGVGVTWTGNDEAKTYANVHKGLTLVAQWRWRQAFIPRVHVRNDLEDYYDDSDDGGTVEIISVTDPLDKNYNAAYNENGGKSYHAATGEFITVKAFPKEDYSFIGWYDENGNLLATNSEYSYYETKESVKTLYAIFSNSITQTYIRQVGNDDEGWTDTTDNAIGTLGRYTYTDAVGMPVSSTAKAGTNYKFIGWYDSDGNPVSDEMLINNGATISYTTTESATYYARFEKTVTQKFIRQVMNGDSWEDTTKNSIGSLTLYNDTDVAGKEVSSTAEAGEDYEFVGWYDVAGNQVGEEKLSDDGRTISYETTGDATYYARFRMIISEEKVTQKFIRQVEVGDSWEDTTENSIGTLTLYNHTDVVGKEVVSTATAGNATRFVGWYDEEGSQVEEEKLSDDGRTISYVTTGDATYYARFRMIISEENVTQEFIRQVEVGESWEETTDDSIGTLSSYTHTDVVGKKVRSTARAGTNYKFIGWYDEDGDPVSDEMLINKGATIRYTTTDDATYYARFRMIISEEKVTQEFIRQVEVGESWEETMDDSIGTLTLYNDTDVVGKEVSSTATAGNATRFVGWYDSEGDPVDDDMLTNGGATISYTTEGNAIYYARFKRTASEENGTQTNNPTIEDEETGDDTTSVENMIQTNINQVENGETLEDVSKDISKDISKDTSNDIPQTGDDSNPALWFMLMLLSTSALAGLFIRKKERS